MALPHQRKERPRLPIAHDAFHQRCEQLALVDQHIHVARRTARVDAVHGHALAASLHGLGHVFEPRRPYGGRSESPQQPSHQAAVRGNACMHPPGRGDDMGAQRNSRRQRFQQVVQGERAVARGAGEERQQIAGESGRQRDAVCAQLVEPLEQRVLGTSRGGVCRHRKPPGWQPVFGQHLYARQRLQRSHPPPATVAAQLRRRFHDAQRAMRIVEASRRQAFAEKSGNGGLQHLGKEHLEHAHVLGMHHPQRESAVSRHVQPRCRRLAEPVRTEEVEIKAGAQTHGHRRKDPGSHAAPRGTQFVNQERHDVGNGHLHSTLESTSQAEAHSKLRSGDNAPFCNIALTFRDRLCIARGDRLVVHRRLGERGRHRVAEALGRQPGEQPAGNFQGVNRQRIHQAVKLVSSGHVWFPHGKTAASIAKALHSAPSARRAQHPP